MAKINKNSFNWLWRYSKGNRRLLVLNMVLGLLQIGAMLLFVYYSKQLIEQAISGDKSESLTPMIALFAGAMIAQQLFSLLRERIRILSSTRMVNKLRGESFRLIMYSYWRGKERLHTGEMVNRLEKDTEAISNLLCITFPQILVSAVQFIAAFLFLRVLDPKLAWILFLIMPLMMILSKVYIFRMRRLTHNIRDLQGDVQSHIQENIQLRTINSTMGSTDSSINKLSTIQKGLLKETLKRLNFSLLSKGTVLIGFTMGYITAFAWGAIGLQEGAISYGVMVAFLQLVAQVQRPVVELSSAMATMAQTLASVDRLSELSELETEESGEQILLDGEVGVRFQDVSFAYLDGDERKILDRFNCDFTPGRLYAVMGRTGAGKSTMIRLILSLLTPNSGKIEIYNKESRSICSPQTRENFIYIPQGNTLSSGTIAQNLLMANPEATAEDIAKALRIAVAEFVYDLPHGLNTLCGERGAGLSEGEAQRVAIARGVLRSGGVLLLDEPTSALDSKTEDLLIQRLKEFAQTRLVIMVTHRELTAKECDCVVEL